MAGSPKYKVYSGRQYVASCKYPSDAAMLMCNYSEGTVRLGHGTILLRSDETLEGRPVNDSWDVAAEVIQQREHEAHLVGYRKATGHA